PAPVRAIHDRALPLPHPVPLAGVPAGGGAVFTAPPSRRRQRAGRRTFAVGDGGVAAGAGRVSALEQRSVPRALSPAGHAAATDVSGVAERRCRSAHGRRRRSGAPRGSRSGRRDGSPLRSPAQTPAADSAREGTSNDSRVRTEAEPRRPA